MVGFSSPFESLRTILWHWSYFSVGLNKVKFLPTETNFREGNQTPVLRTRPACSTNWASQSWLEEEVCFAYLNLKLSWGWVFKLPATAGNLKSLIFVLRSWRRLLWRTPFISCTIFATFSLQLDTCRGHDRVSKLQTDSAEIEEAKEVENHVSPHYLLLKPPAASMEDHRNGNNKDCF